MLVNAIKSCNFGNSKLKKVAKNHSGPHPQPHPQHSLDIKRPQGAKLCCDTFKQ